MRQILFDKYLFLGDFRLFCDKWKPTFPDDKNLS